MAVVMDFGSSVMYWAASSRNTASISRQPSMWAPTPATHPARTAAAFLFNSSNCR